MDFNEATQRRAAALDTLITHAEAIAGADDYGDMIGAVRLVELAAEQARRAVVVEAITSGQTWTEVGQALGMTGAEAETAYRKSVY